MKITPKTGRQPSARNLQIEFSDGQAHEVCLAGSFNDWSPSATPMLYRSHDRWIKELALPPGRYEYQLPSPTTGQSLLLRPLITLC